MPAKSKRLTNKEKALKSKVKKELQEQGLLPPDKPRLNRRKFAKEAAEQFDKEINLMNPMDVFWFHNALTLVTAGTDVLPITSEQVGVFKLMKITAEIKKLHEETKKSGKEVTVRDVCKISDFIMKL